MILASIVVSSGLGGSPGAGMSLFFIQMLAIVAIFYFLIIRPKMQQEKKHKARLESIRTRDEVVTAGGIVGEVVHVKDDRVTVKSGESRFIVQRDRIAVVRSPGEPEENHWQREQLSHGSATPKKTKMSVWLPHKFNQKTEQAVTNKKAEERYTFGGFASM